MDKLEEGRYLGLPLFNMCLPESVSPRQLNSCHDEWRESPASTISALGKLFPGSLQQLKGQSFQGQPALDEGRVEFPHLELYLKIIRSEQMNHPRNPALLFRHFLQIILLLASGTTTHNHRNRGTHASVWYRKSAVPLVSDQDVTHIEHASNIFWRVDDRFVFEERADDSVGNGATGDIRLNE